MLADLEVKSKAPNGIAFTVRGKAPHNGGNSGSVGLDVDSASYLLGLAVHPSIRTHWLMSQ